MKLSSNYGRDQIAQLGRLKIHVPNYLEQHCTDPIKEATISIVETKAGGGGVKKWLSLLFKDSPLPILIPVPRKATKVDLKVVNGYGSNMNTLDAQFTLPSRGYTVQRSLYQTREGELSQDVWIAKQISDAKLLKGSHQGELYYPKPVYPKSDGIYL